MKKTLLVSVADVEDEARKWRFGFVECPWDGVAFAECHSFTIYKEEVEQELKTDPENCWAKTCLKILKEKKISSFTLVL